MAAVLQRTTFVTSRLSEFANQRELVAQTGHSVRNWPLVILKECADNALDVCEEKQIAPVLEISVDTAAGEIVFTDNGPGIAPEIVVSILDYTTRTSSREAYITQSRGQQGNALKTVVAMPFTLDNARCGPVVIEAHGVAHQIQFGVNQITQEPQIAHETASSLVKSGTRLTVSWPATASAILEEAKGEFLQIARFSLVEPAFVAARDLGRRCCDRLDVDRAAVAQVARLRSELAALVRPGALGKVGRCLCRRRPKTRTSRSKPARVRRRVCRPDQHGKTEAVARGSGRHTNLLIEVLLQSRRPDQPWRQSAAPIRDAGVLRTSQTGAVGCHRQRTHLGMLCGCRCRTPQLQICAGVRHGR
jgi:hypothetical protein